MIPNNSLFTRHPAGGGISWSQNLLDLLDPHTVIRDVEVIENVGGVIFPEDPVNVQQALKHTGLPWAKKETEKEDNHSSG